LRATLAASLAVSLLGMAWLPPVPSLAGPPPAPPPAQLVNTPETDTVPAPGDPPALSSVVPSRPFRVLEKAPRPRR